MPVLKPNPTLSDFQDYVKQIVQERGFTDNTVLQNSLLLGEEVGELFKSIRKQEGLKTETNSKVSLVSEEIADIFIYLCTIANYYKIELEKAFRDKEKINQERSWT
ncbi:MAG: MazG nucleotide pyrophosphohydrolase domain-containing protein [Patescibacteria group bacterium]